MHRAFRLFLLSAAVLLSLASCSKFRRYDGPEVTRLSVYKAERVLLVHHHDQVLEAYRIDLGFAPAGHKQFEGDGRTPEGSYFINRRNPDSDFHLSLGISYPNDADREAARLQGKSPGGDIFIHGSSKGRRDWTAGCIAVKNREIEQLYAMVRDGTPIDIYP